MPADRPDPWSLYTRLIEGIPDGIEVTDALVNRWAAVRTETGSVGLGMTYSGGPAAPPDAWDTRGRPLREVAAYVTSWDLRLAAVGVAALNAWYATPELLARPGVVRGPGANFFRSHAQALGSVRAAVVGHFPDVEQFGENVTVLERDPRGDDLPDAACEYVLGECELVAITGSTVVNKTLPRLLALAGGAEVHIVGPTAPPAPDAYPACVVEIAGSVVVDPDAAWRLVGLGLRQLVDSSALEMFAYPLTPDH